MGNPLPNLREHATLTLESFASLTCFAYDVGDPLSDLLQERDFDRLLGVFWQTRSPRIGSQFCMGQGETLEKLFPVLFFDGKSHNVGSFESNDSGNLRA